MPTEIGDDLIALTREICDKSLRPQVDEVEARAATEEVFPREVFRTLGQAGLLSLPYPEELGGGGQPYESTCRSSRRSPPRGPRSGSGCRCTP